jgi:hypothetical protein
MKLFDRLLHRRSALDLYMELIETSKTRLGNYRAEAPFAYDAMLCDSKMIEKLSDISKKDPEIYWRSRFLGGMLSAAWSIQRKASWEQARIESVAAASGELRMVDPAAVLATVLHVKDEQLQREVLLEGAGIAAIAVRHDADVDLKVARDLGRADAYPDRPPMPAVPNEDETFRVTSMRVRLFWQTVLPLPLYPLLDIATRPAPRPGAPVEPEKSRGPRSSDRDMVGVLDNLCVAYASNHAGAIAHLEPQATRIGKALDQRGGIEEMRRVFALVRPQPGRRTLEMHWNGIGEWRG